MFRFKRRSEIKQSKLTEEAIPTEKSQKSNTMFFPLRSVFSKRNDGKNLRSLIKSSYVIPEPGGFAANEFYNTERFNRVCHTINQSEKESLIEEKTRLMSGTITPLIGKGIISSRCANKELPVRYDYVIIDSEHNRVSRETSEHEYGVNSYNGLGIKSAEIIPGTPIGNYHNKQTYPKELNVIQIDNGNCGTIGLRFNLEQLKPDTPLLIHGGELSGCTMAFAIKDNYFYAFHCGQFGNNKSLWKTSHEGVETIINAHLKLADTHPKAKMKFDNQVLVEHFQDNFDSSIIVFCGHGENTTSNKGNVITFDYNKPIPSTENRKSRVANAAVVLLKLNGGFKITALGDDMNIDNESLETESNSNIISSLI